MALSTTMSFACGMGGSETPPNDDGGVTPPPITPPPVTPSEDDFDPITRFVVTSDVHVRENGDLDSLDRLNAVFDTAYNYSDNHSTYKQLDAIFFAGDNTNNGYQAEQQLFFNTVNSKTRTDTVARAVMGNHEFYATKTDEGSYSQSSMQNAPVKFLQYSGYQSTDAHLVIDGYHYILLSMDKYGTYTGRANEYLSQSLSNGFCHIGLYLY